LGTLALSGINTFKCNCLTPLHCKGLIVEYRAQFVISLCFERRQIIEQLNKSYSQSLTYIGRYSCEMLCSVVVVTTTVFGQMLTLNIDYKVLSMVLLLTHSLVRRIELFTAGASPKGCLPNNPV